MFNQDGTRKGNTFSLIQGKKYIASRLLSRGIAAARKYIETARKNSISIVIDMSFNKFTNLEARYVLYHRYGKGEYSALEKAARESTSAAQDELKNVLGVRDAAIFLIRATLDKEKCFNAETFSGRELTVPTGLYYRLSKIKNKNRSIAILNYKEYAEPEYMCWHLDVMHKKENKTKAKKVWMFQTKDGELNVTGKTRDDTRRYMVGAVARATVARLSGV